MYTVRESIESQLVTETDRNIFNLQKNYPIYKYKITRKLPYMRIYYDMKTTYIKIKDHGKFTLYINISHFI